MNVLIVSKEVVESLNEMNTSNHKPVVTKLVDGRYFVHAKLLHEPLYEKYQKYFLTCEVEEINKKNIYKQYKTLEDASNKI